MDVCQFLRLKRRAVWRVSRQRSARLASLAPSARIRGCVRNADGRSSTFFCSTEAENGFDHLLHGFCYVEMTERPRSVTVEMEAETTLLSTSAAALIPAHAT